MTCIVVTLLCYQPEAFASDLGDGQSRYLYIRAGYFVFSVFPVCYCLVVSTSAIDCLERLVSEMTCYVLSVTLNPTHSLFSK